MYNLCGKLTAVPIMNASGSWIVSTCRNDETASRSSLFQLLSFQWSMWVPAFFCALSLAIVIVYAVFERSIPEENKIMTGRKLAARCAERGVFQTKTTLAARYTYVKMSIFAIPAAFWLLILSQLLQCQFTSFPPLPSSTS